MQVETGAILEGKVTGITNFGAFVELPGGQTGMVHISEVASAFVTDIRQHKILKASALRHLPLSLSISKMAHSIFPAPPAGL